MSDASRMASGMLSVDIRNGVSFSWYGTDGEGGVYVRGDLLAPTTYFRLQCVEIPYEEIPERLRKLAEDAPS